MNYSSLINQLHHLKDITKMPTILKDLWCLTMKKGEPFELSKKITIVSLLTYMIRAAIHPFVDLNDKWHSYFQVYEWVWLSKRFFTLKQHRTVTMLSFIATIKLAQTNLAYCVILQNAWQ